MRTHQRALVGSFPGSCKNWLGSDVCYPTRLRLQLQQPRWSLMFMDSSRRCGIGGNPRTHSRLGEQCNIRDPKPDVQCSKGVRPVAPAILGFGTEVAPTVGGLLRSGVAVAGDTMRHRPGPLCRGTPAPVRSEESKTSKPRQIEQTDTSVQAYHEASASAAQATCTDQTLQSHRSLL